MGDDEKFIESVQEEGSKQIARKYDFKKLKRISFSPYYLHSAKVEIFNTVQKYEFKIIKADQRVPRNPNNCLVFYVYSTFNDRSNTTLLPILST